MEMNNQYLILVFKKLILGLLALLASSCQWMTEFPAPRTLVIIKGLTPEKAGSLYSEIANYLNRHGLEEEQTQGPFICVTPTGSASYKKTNTDVRYFKSTERASLYVISAVLCINGMRNSVMYQFEEINLETLSKVPPIFSLKGCQIIVGLRKYIQARTNTDNVDYDHNLKCYATHQ